ncbi:MAG: 30S ribosome-binding factor RbfA [Myxococcales bacterium]|nr:30S ribosome-binding factor RbfA [Myxococcales bacterium]
MNERPRAERVATELAEELAGLIRGSLADPRVEGVIVTRAVMSPDLRNARVYFRLAVGADEPGRVDAASRGLERASARLKKQAAKRLGLRWVPELHFHYDEGQDARDRIDELLEEVRRDRGE